MIEFLLADARRKEIEADERRLRHQADYARLSTTDRLDKAISSARAALHLKPSVDRA